MIADMHNANIELTKKVEIDAARETLPESICRIRMVQRIRGVLDDRFHDVYRHLIVVYIKYLRHNIRLASRMTGMLNEGKEISMQAGGRGVRQFFSKSC